MRRYRDKREAIAALHRIASTSTRTVVPRRAYYCRHCRGFHLTSKEKR